MDDTNDQADLPPLHLDVNFDTSIYDDNGEFTVRVATSAGVANRLTAIPMTFTPQR